MRETVNLVSSGVFISIDFPYQQKTKNYLPGTEELLFPWNLLRFWLVDQRFNSTPLPANQKYFICRLFEK